MERAPLRKLRLHCGNPVVLFLFGSLAFVASCGKPVRSFSTLLDEIDSSFETATTEQFVQAAKLASGTEEQIKLLKRASLRSPDFYADIAASFAGGRLVAEPVALAMLDAFLSANRCIESLQLFNGSLDASNWPSEFVETLILSFRNGCIPAITMEQLVASADCTGDSRLLVYASVQAMLDGDRATARTLLIDAGRFGGSDQDSIPYQLLWDAGAIDVLSQRVANPADPLEVAVCADAEYLVGDHVSASTSWTYLINRFPAWSWKPYAALARTISSETDSALQDWPHVPPADSWSTVSSSSVIEASLYSRIEELFPDSVEASLERARWLHSKNRIDEARGIATSLTGEAAAIATLEYGIPERSVPDALRLVSEYTLSPAVNDVALEVLATARAWERFSELAENCNKNGLATRRSWFWQALAMVLDDDASNAASMLRMYGPGQAGYAGAFNVGILELASNRVDYAAEAFMIAVGLARSSREKAAAYVRAGDALQLSKLPVKAILAYEAAIGADPASREARSRLMRLKLNN